MVIKEPKSKKPIIPASKMNPRPAAMPACSLYPLQGSLMLLDAHLVFQPFLAALGVSPHQVTQGNNTNVALRFLIKEGQQSKVRYNSKSTGFDK